MTKEMRDMLVDQLDTAKTPDEVDRAMAGGMKAMIDCQYKTSERVKGLVIEEDRKKARFEGAKWIWGVLGGLAASGGGAIVLKLLQTIKL